MRFMFRSKRSNIRAWEYALFEGKNDPLALPNIELYARLTESLIENDCRIILESVQIAASTDDAKVKRGRKKLAGERYRHMLALKPYAAPAQMQLIKSAIRAYRSI